MQRLLGLGGFLLGAVADDGVALRQVQVECDERPVLQTQCSQGGAIDLREEEGHTRVSRQVLPSFSKTDRQLWVPMFHNTVGPRMSRNGAYLSYIS